MQFPFLMLPVSDSAESRAVQDEPTVEERRALILRVASSEQFKRSARLRDFLLYVGKQSLNDNRPKIHEQEIGEKVFGRPAGYDRGLDNIVRVNASELRKRVDAYFETAGAAESLIFEIPRGAYNPAFSRRTPKADAQLPPPAENATPAPDASPVQELKQPTRAGIPAAVGITALAASLVLAVACVVLLVQLHNTQMKLHPWRSSPAVAAFWENFLGSNQETDIILPDSSVSLNEEITRRQIPLNDYLNRSYLSQINSSSLGDDRKGDLEGIFSHNLVTFGDVRAAQQILALDPSSPSLRLTTARFSTADSMKNHNVILIGGAKANPWVMLFDDQMNFSLDQDNNTLLMAVTNRKPQAGESARYAESSSQKGPVGYSIIAYLPNPGHTGNAIILAGTSSEATHAAAEFLTSEDQMKQLRSVLHSGKLPHFEALLKTSQLSGTSFHAELVAYRAYPDSR
jgi:hypothetical protein